jgi:hypothetical protein
MEIVRKASITTPANSGVRSEQLLFDQYFSRDFPRLASCFPPGALPLFSAFLI